MADGTIGGGRGRLVAAVCLVVALFIVQASCVSTVRGGSEVLEPADASEVNDSKGGKAVEDGVRPEVGSTVQAAAADKALGVEALLKAENELSKPALDMLQAKKAGCTGIVNSVCGQLCTGWEEGPECAGTHFVFAHETCFSIKCTFVSDSQAYHLHMRPADAEKCPHKKPVMECGNMKAKKKECEVVSRALRSTHSELWSGFLKGASEGIKEKRVDSVNCDSAEMNFGMRWVEKWRYNAFLADTFPDPICEELTGKTYPCFRGDCLYTAPVNALFGTNDALTRFLAPADDDNDILAGLSRMAHSEREGCAKAVRSQLRLMASEMRHVSDMEGRTVFFMETLKEKCPSALSVEGGPQPPLAALAHGQMTSEDITSLVDVYLNVLGVSIPPDQRPNPGVGSVSMYTSLQTRKEYTFGEKLDDMLWPGTLVREIGEKKFSVSWGVELPGVDSEISKLDSSDWHNVPLFFYVSIPLTEDAFDAASIRKVPRTLTIKGKEYRAVSIITQNRDFEFSSYSLCAGDFYLGGDLKEMHYGAVADDKEPFIAINKESYGVARLVMYYQSDRVGDVDE